MIGVFDSGFGGLTVHHALIEALPGRDFVYLGDNRNAPYGVRPPIDVLNLTCAALERLFAEGCTLAVVACNTASTVALRWIQQQWLPVRRRDDGIAKQLGLASTIFLKLIKSIIAPLVLGTLVAGIAGVGDIKSMGGRGG